MNVVEVPIQKLKPWPDLNPRRRFDKDELAELAASIKQHGILEPVLVHESNGDGPWVVAGDRRLRAAKLAGLKTVPCLVREYSEVEALEIALIENVERSDLTVIEEARGFQKWLTATGQSQRQLAKKIGRSQPYIANRIRLLELPDEVLALVEDDVIEMSWARDYLLPFTAVTIEAKRTKLFAAIAKAVGKEKPTREADFCEIIDDTAMKLARPLEAFAYQAKQRPVADLDHSSCTCGAPGVALLRSYGRARPLAICFDEDWWNGANSKAQEKAKVAEKRARERAKSTAKAIDTSKVLTEDTLQQKLGWGGYEVLTDKGGHGLGNLPFLDPSQLPAESLARVKVKHSRWEDGKSKWTESEEIACIDKKAIAAAKGAASRELGEALTEERAEAMKKELAAARRRKITGATLRTAFLIEPYDVAELAEQIGLLESTGDEDDGPGSADVFERLDDSQFEILGKAVQMRVERKEIDPRGLIGRDPIEERIRKRLRDKYSKRLRTLVAAIPTNGKKKPTKKKGAKTAA